MNRKQVLTQAQLGGETQQTKTFEGGKTMQAVAQSQIEFVHLYDHPPIPPVPWKFVVEDTDWFWPVGWFLYPIGDGELWLVKKESPRNIHAKERCDALIGIKVNGELVFAEPEWNNEVLQVWERERVASLFDGVKRGEYSGVVIKENCSEEEREKVEKMLRWLTVIRLLLEDKERITEYGEVTFGRYVERYYSRWLKEFREFFEGIGKLKGEERVRLLEKVKTDLENRLDETGFFMYIYYP